MALPLGALLSAGGSLMSGLFGGGVSQKKIFSRQLQVYLDMLRASDEANRIPHITKSTSSAASAGGVDIKRMRDDAEAAGFNPLTAMRSGLGSLYGWTTNTQSNETYETGHNAGLKAELIAQFLGSGALNSGQGTTGGIGSAVGGALSSLGSALTEDARIAQDQQFQMIKQSAYLKGVLGSGRGTNGSSMFSIPSVISAGRSARTSGANAATTNGTFQVPFMSTPIYLPKSRPASDAENEIGEFGGDLYGMVRAFEILQDPRNVPAFAKALGVSDKTLTGRIDATKDVLRNPSFGNLYSVYKAWSNPGDWDSRFRITVQPHRAPGT